jgi:hypothetical protein
MVNTIFNYTYIEKCKMQLQLNILIGEKNPELNWLTRPDPTRPDPTRPDPYHFKIFTTRPDPTRPDPRMDPTRDQLCVNVMHVFPHALRELFFDNVFRNTGIRAVKKKILI